MNSANFAFSDFYEVLLRRANKSAATASRSWWRRGLGR
jgi:hypothetical protein